MNARHNLISKIQKYLSDYLSHKLKISFTHKIMALNEPSNTKYWIRAIMRKMSMRMRPFLKYHSLKICLSKNESVFLLLFIFSHHFKKFIFR